MSRATEQLRSAVAELAGTPGDLGAWLKVALHLGEAGRSEQAAAAFERLGRAANRLGQVALAVACARSLDGMKRAEQASALIDAIAHLHHQGSPKIASAARLAPPPAPPETAAVTIELGATPAAIAGAAMKVIDVAEKAARDRAPSTLAPTPLLRGLQPEGVVQLISVMKLRRHQPGEVIVEIGQPARALYWVARGTAQVSRDGHLLGELQAGSFFGEIALVSGTRRTAKVTCTSELWLLEVPAAELEAVAARAPRLAKVLARYARARLLANVMRTSELFSRLPDAERAELLPRFTTRLVAAGEHLAKKGDENDSLYVLVSGRCQVRDGAQLLATLTVGDGFGEMSLLSRGPAVADVVATEPTVLLCLTREQFDDVAVKHPGLLAEVYKLRVAREQANRDAIIHDAGDLII